MVVEYLLARPLSPATAVQSTAIAWELRVFVDVLRPIDLRTWRNGKREYGFLELGTIETSMTCGHRLHKASFHRGPSEFSEECRTCARVETAGIWPFVSAIRGQSLVIWSTQSSGAKTPNAQGKDCKAMWGYR